MRHEFRFTPAKGEVINIYRETNVYKYLAYLLEHRPNADMSDEQLEDLAPWNEEVKSSCQN